MTPRRLVPVVLDGAVQTGSKHPAPRIGDIATYCVSFTEAREYTDPADPTVTTLTARVEPLHGGQPIRNAGVDGAGPDGWPRWSSVLHLPGWAAFWVSFRPPPGDAGPVELRGRLTSDFAALCPCWVRGRISRLWMTTARRDRPVDPWKPSSREPAWGSHRLIPMTEQPLLGSGLVLPELPPHANESGWLVELELDDLPDDRTGGVRRS